jgi:hypothetical protein
MITFIPDKCAAMFRLIKTMLSWIFITAVFFISCKKEETSAITLLEQYFEANVINKNFIISFASDNGTELTSKYADYTFRLLKTDFYHGPLEAQKNSTITTGTWSSNDDYSKLIITLPDTPSELIFLTRQWRFTKKRPEQLELAPWGSTEPVILYMKRQ